MAILGEEIIGIHLLHGHDTVLVLAVNNHLILIVAVGLDQLTGAVQLVVVDSVDAGALTAAAVLELEGKGVAVNLNRLSAGLHGAVIRIAEVEGADLAAGNLGSVVNHKIVERILGVVGDIAVVSKLLIDLGGIHLAVLGRHLQEYQTVNHTAVVVERILFALDGLDHVGVNLAVAVRIVPVIVAVVVFILMQVITGNNLEPALGSACAVLGSAEIHKAAGIGGNALGCGAVGSGLREPVGDHAAILVEAVFSAVDGLGL